MTPLVWHKTKNTAVLVRYTVQVLRHGFISGKFQLSSKIVKTHVCVPHLERLIDFSVLEKKLDISL